MYCPKCGAEITHYSKYCRKCGTKLPYNKEFEKDNSDSSLDDEKSLTANRQIIFFICFGLDCYYNAICICYGNIQSSKSFKH